LQLSLAPIRGITDHVFRTIFTRHFKGFDDAMAPFISTVKGKTVKKSHLRDILPENNRRLPVIPQIIGNNPEDFVVLARTLADLGYGVVNWNLGCPFPQVTGKKRGSGLLPHPERIREFLDRVLPKIPNSVSIKTRLGLVSSNELGELVGIFNGFPLAEIIIHPRTGRQLYGGEVDLDAFGRFSKALKHPVAFNGDITTKDGFDVLKIKFPEISRWMIGRGALANPFLAEILRGGAMDVTAMNERIKGFHDDLLETYIGIFNNGGNVVDKMKGIWLYISKTFPNGATFLKSVQKTRHLDEYRGELNRFLKW
jgi:tRNA-dihydrouridine synthase